MHGPKIKNFTHDDMIRACKRNCINPVIFLDEQFVQISIYIPEVQDYYYISTYGRIFSQITGFIYGTSITNAGYEYVTLCTKYKCVKGFSVHRLVMLCFNPIPNSHKMAVNHIDGNKRNNHISNLEWVTNSENMIHCYRNNLEINGIDHPWSTLTEEQVHQICQLLEQGKCDSDIALIMFNDIHRTGVINSIRHGRSWVIISQNYNIPKKVTYNNKRRFDENELRTMNHYVSLGMKPKDVAIAAGIDLSQYNQKDRERIYRVIRNLRDKTAYQYIFDE